MAPRSYVNTNARDRIAGGLKGICAFDSTKLQSEVCIQKCQNSVDLCGQGCLYKCWYLSVLSLDRSNVYVLRGPLLQYKQPPHSSQGRAVAACRRLLELSHHSNTQQLARQPEKILDLKLKIRKLHAFITRNRTQQQHPQYVEEKAPAPLSNTLSPRLSLFPVASLL